MRKAFICPSKYVQGEGELYNLGYFVNTFGKSALLIAHPDDIGRVRNQLDATAQRFGIGFVEGAFSGECTREEVQRLKTQASKNHCSCTIGLGGGKAIDTAKCVAQGEALIIVPTIAATDAPTSHAAVLYHGDGSFDEYAFFKQSPSVVLIDTEMIAKAPVRFLVSGMGDALATYFEARAANRAFADVNAGAPCGAREGVCAPAKSTKAAFALASLCYQSLMEDGYKAKCACEMNSVTQALENIVETNILLSGLGFESGGLAAAHAVHDGLTIMEGTHAYYHGEKVAFGTLTQLVLEDAPEKELREVLDFCLKVGLPVCLKDIGIEKLSGEELENIAGMACGPQETMGAMPFVVSPGMVASAIITADKIGREYKAFTIGRRKAHE